MDLTSLLRGHCLLPIGLDRLVEGIIQENLSAGHGDTLGCNDGIFVRLGRTGSSSELDRMISSVGVNAVHGVKGRHNVGGVAEISGASCGLFLFGMCQEFDAKLLHVLHIVLSKHTVLNDIYKASNVSLNAYPWFILLFLPLVTPMGRQVHSTLQPVASAAALKHASIFSIRRPICWYLVVRMKKKAEV